MAVLIGSARIDENGRATGGQAGDQTGKEVSTQNWYLNSKGWRVFRAKDPAKRGKIAAAMKAACENPQIGYDQNQRDTLYNDVKSRGFDPALTSKNVETDCSALVRVCCAFAGIPLPNFYTGDQARTMLDSGAFDEMTGARYQESSDYLMAGDVLVTKTKGHTVAVLTDGPLAGTTPREWSLGERILKNGCKGADVKEMQEGLILLEYDLGRWGADGDFGDATELAVRTFQNDHGLETDGEFGPLSLAEFRKALEALEVDENAARYVRIQGGNCYVRSAPNTDGEKMGVVHDGALLPFGGVVSPAGWFLVAYTNRNGWVSGKYGRLVKA